MKENRVPDGESEKIRKIEFPKGKSERRRKIRFPMGERERNRKRFRVLLNNARTTTHGGVLGGHQQHRHGKGETATHDARSTSQNEWHQVIQTQKFGKTVVCVENRMKEETKQQTTNHSRSGQGKEIRGQAKIPPRWRAARHPRVPGRHHETPRLTN